MVISTILGYLESLIGYYFKIKKKHYIVAKNT